MYNNISTVLIRFLDRLQPVGVCIGYERSLKIMETLGGKYKEQLIEAILRTSSKPMAQYLSLVYTIVISNV